MTSKFQKTISPIRTNYISGELAVGGEYPTKTPSFDEVNLTTPEAAAYCRMAIPTFRLYLSRGEISGIKLGKAWLFTRADLDAFLNRYRTKSNAEIAEQANQILRRARR